MLRTWADRSLRVPARQSAARPGLPGAPWGMSLGDRGGVARSYLTPDAQWHTIWRGMANPGE
ncbi:hypothetical protein GCM10010251_74410 [Streptomyces aurantiogriseus]|uniref:Uncharacterized protein n=1 Tax=Streptomyces aurantiogriseus TaxID=66870 RepID=A0A918FKF5_9ACTN|nr:hypothetical protein GCM10010251_74410 [Streptomyces aurantiogriseus]